MPQFTPFCFRQAGDESLESLPRPGGGPKTVTFTHVIHAYTDHAVPFNTKVQQTTFETMRIAARVAAPQIPVSCVCVTFPEDAKLIPADFVGVPRLDRLVTQMAKFQHPRPLPLLYDILDLAFAERFGPVNEPTSEDFIVFSNSDICLQPYFYLTIAALVQQGYDIITVNRRAISRYEERQSDLALMFGEYGEDHPGFDCFVFPSRFYQAFVKSDPCIGAGVAMRGLLFNFACFASQFLMLTKAHLTFHCGADGYWRNPKFADYERYNFAQARGVAIALAQDRAKAQRLVAFMRANNENREFIRTVADTAGLAPDRWSGRDAIASMKRWLKRR